MNNFWKKLKRPFFIQAPMADVTDFAFRSIIADCGSPDVIYTEFVSADGLMHPIARQKLLIDLKHNNIQHPIVAQIFSGNPDKIEGASKLCVELGFDGIDINMGCPDRSIEKQGAGSNLIKDPSRAMEIIEAAKTSGLPVSVKTRLAYSSVDDMDTWVSSLLKTSPSCLIMHLRTRMEMSKVPAHWEVASRLIKLRDEIQSNTLIACNGDVTNLDDANDKAAKYGLDGIMLGRAIFGNPWLYSKRNKNDIDWDERLQTILRHTKLFEDTFINEPIAKGLKPYKGFQTMRKFYSSYVQGHRYAKNLKEKLMKCNNYSEVVEIISNI